MADQRKDKAGNQDIQVAFTEFDQTPVRIDPPPFFLSDNARWSEVPLTKGEFGGSRGIFGTHELIAIVARGKRDFIPMLALAFVAWAWGFA